MAKKHRYTQAQLVKRLEKEGYKVGKRATHGVRMTKPGILRPIIVPKCGGGTLPVGLSDDILKQAGVEDL